MSDATSVIPNAASWPVRSLHDVTTVLRRGTAPVYVEASEVRAIGQRCVTSTDFIPALARPHSRRAMGNVLMPERGDVLINSTGTGTIGRSIVFQERSGQYIVDGHVTVARPKSGQLVGRWLNDILRSPWGQRYLESHCYSGSTNQIELSVSALSKMRIPIPSFSEQLRIAEVLGALDEQIRSARQIIAKLTLVRQGLLADLLTRGVCISGRARTGDQSRYVEHEPIGRFPNGWDVTTCEDICREITVGIVVRPTQYYKAVGVPVLRSANIRSNGLAMHDLVYMSEADHVRMAKTAVGPDDLVTVRTGYPGTTAVIPDSVIRANCVDVIITRPGPLVLPQFLALWVNSDYGKGQVLRLQGGLAQQHFNVSEMKSMVVVLPGIDEQHLIVERMQAIDQLCSTESLKLAKLMDLKWSLSTDLLRGSARVPVESNS